MIQNNVLKSKKRKVKNAKSIDLYQLYVVENIHIFSLQYEKEKHGKPTFLNLSGHNTFKILGGFDMSIAIEK